MSTIGEYISQGIRNGAVLSTFDKELIRYFQLGDSIAAVSQSCNPLGPDFTAHVAPTPHGSGGVVYQNLLGNRDYLMWALHKWATMQHRYDTLLPSALLPSMLHFSLPYLTLCSMILWDHEVSGSQRLAVEQKVRGIELICEASAFQSEMLSCFFRDALTPAKDDDQSHSPYYSWPLVGISQMLRRDSWKMLECDLPVLDPDTLREQALVMVDRADQATRKAALSVAFYIPLVYGAGKEMHTKDDQARVLQFFDNSRARQLPIAELFRKDLVHQWAQGQRYFHVCDDELLEQGLIMSETQDGTAH